MLIVNAKKDEAILLSAAKKIFIKQNVNGKGYDVCGYLTENLSFNAGIDRDYDTVQKIFLWLMENRISKKTIVISEEFISETLKEIEIVKRREEERKKFDDEEWAEY